MLGAAAGRGTNFSILSEVPVGSWGSAEALLLERALAARSAAAPGDPAQDKIVATLELVVTQCSQSAAAAFSTALCLLRHTRTGPPKHFAVMLLERAVTGWWAITERDKQELLGLLNALLRFVPEVAPAAQITSLSKVIQEGRQALPGPSPSSRARLHRRTASFPDLSGQPQAAGKASSGPLVLKRVKSSAFDERMAQPRQKQIDTLRDRDFFPVDPPRGELSWWRARHGPRRQGAPAFRGEQFRVPTVVGRPVGRLDFENYQRCQTSTF